MASVDLRFAVALPVTTDLLFGTAGAPSQYARPASDITDGAWLPSTGTDLFAMVDEATYSDTDYVYTESASACTMALGSLTDPVSSAGHILRYRMLSGSGSLTIRLKQGASTIATFGPHTATGAAQDFEQTLTGGQADSITDYTALRVELEAA